jgi:abortive infection protein
MSITALLVLISFLQLAIRFLLDLLFPTLFEVNGFLFFYLAFSTLLSIALPTFLYMKNEDKPYFCNVYKDVRPDRLLLLTVLLGVVCQFAGMALNLPVISAVTKWIGPISNRVPEITTPGGLLLGIVVMGLIPGVCEEILFRGVIFNAFREYGTKCAVVFSALMFAMLHMDVTNFVGPFVMGIVFGVMAAKTNRLIYPMIAHFFVNTTATVLTYATQFDVFNDFYNDFILFIMLASLIAIFPLTSLFVKWSEKRELQYYVDYKEKVTEINDGRNSIRIIEHDIKENNFKLALQALFAKPSFYLLIALFIIVGGSIFYA